MENQERTRLEGLRSTLDARKNMLEVENYINLMTVNKSIMIWADQTIDHDEEADYDEVEKEREQANEYYNDNITMLKGVIKSKDLDTVKEFLGLLKKEASEKFEAIKSPMYAPQHERMEFSSEQMFALMEKRDAYAMTRCVIAAQNVARSVEKSTGGEGK